MLASIFSILVIIIQKLENFSEMMELASSAVLIALSLMIIWFLRAYKTKKSKD